MAQYTVVTQKDPLNLRSSASATATILCTIPNYAQITAAPMLVTNPPKETETDSNGTLWRRVQYGEKIGWVANQYLQAGIVPKPANKPTTPTVPTYVPTTGNNNSNNTNSNQQAMTLTDSMKTKLKIGAIVLGAGVLGFGIYKMTKKPKAAAASRTALSGVSTRRRRKSTTKKAKASSAKRRKTATKTRVKQLN